MKLGYNLFLEIKISIKFIKRLYINRKKSYLKAESFATSDSFFIEMLVFNSYKVLNIYNFIKAYGGIHYL